MPKLGVRSPPAAARISRTGEPARVGDLGRIQVDLLVRVGHRVEAQHQRARVRPRLAGHVAQIVHVRPRPPRRPRAPRSAPPTRPARRTRPGTSSAASPRPGPGSRPRCCRAGTARPSPGSPSCTSTITAGSVRGHICGPSASTRTQPPSRDRGRLRRWPASTRCRACQLASATAVMSSPASQRRSSIVPDLADAERPGQVVGLGRGQRRRRPRSTARRPASTPRNSRSPARRLARRRARSTSRSPATSARPSSTTRTRARSQASASHAGSVRRWAARSSAERASGGVTTEARRGGVTPPSAARRRPHPASPSEARPPSSASPSTTVTALAGAR